MACEYLFHHHSHLVGSPIHSYSDCHRPYIHACDYRVYNQRPISQARAEDWFTYRCRFWGCWIRYLGTQVSFHRPFKIFASRSHISIRLSFNLTLFITSVFVLSGGASPNSITLCSLAAVWSIGVGGILPVDSAIFLGMSGATIGVPGSTS
jgi:hypothetical protein